MIRGYTREAGVRNLEREIGALCRKVARRRAEGNETPIEITPDVVVEMLGAPKFLDEEMEERTKDPGVAIGLAWTPAGGEVLFIEASRMAGTGSLTLTGQLGDVMKESARAALSWLRTHAKEYGIDPDFFKNAEMHVHVPSGAIPKDGPSAGVTMATAMASQLTGRPVRGDLAMTGEITLSGRVLPIGGIKEKVLAARRVGIREVILPKQNAKNVNEDLTPELRQDMTVHLVSTIDEVLALALQPVVVRRRGRSRSRRRPTSPAQAGVRSARIEGRLLGPVSHRYRAARLSHRQVPSGSRPSPRDGRDPARRRRRAASPRAGTSSRSSTPREYLARMRDGTLSPEDVAQLELPWSPEMVDGFRLMIGGTIQAALIACGLAHDGKRRAAEHAEKRSLRTLRTLRSTSSVTSAAGCTTRFRITAKASVRSTTSPSRFAFCRRAASSASPSSISTSTTATARRSSSSPIRASSPSRCTSSTTTRCGSRAARSTSACRTARTTRRSSRELERALPAVMAHRPQCVFYLAGADPYEDDQLGGLRLTQRRPAAARSAGDRRRSPRRRAAGRHAGRRLCAPRRGHRGDPRRDDRGSQEVGSSNVDLAISTAKVMRQRRRGISHRVRQRSALCWRFVGGAMLMGCAVTAAAQSSPRDYPQWRGLNRDGAASAFAEPASWPETLTRKWKVDVGEGYGTPLVVADTVYVFTRRNSTEVMTALERRHGQGAVAHELPGTVCACNSGRGSRPGSKGHPAFPQWQAVHPRGDRHCLCLRCRNREARLADARGARASVLRHVRVSCR